VLSPRGEGVGAEEYCADNTPSQDQKLHVQTHSDIDVSQNLVQQVAYEPRGQQVQIYNASQLSVPLHQIIKRAQTPAAGLHGRVPTVNVLPATSYDLNYNEAPELILSRDLPAGFESYEQTRGYERVKYSKAAEQIFDLIFKGETQSDSDIPIAASCVHRNVNGQNIHSQTSESATHYEQISGYERVRYSEALEQMMSRGRPPAGYEPYGQISGYERVQYSKTAEQMFNLIFKGGTSDPMAASHVHQNVQCYDENIHDTHVSVYERIHYSEALEQMMSRSRPPAGYEPYGQISGYERVHYSENAERIFNLIFNAEERSEISMASSCVHQDMASQNQNLHSLKCEPALPHEQISGYERVRYSRAVEQMMKGGNLPASLNTENQAEANKDTADPWQLQQNGLGTLV
jgi:hypothetical protein